LCSKFPNIFIKLFKEFSVILRVSLLGNKLNQSFFKLCGNGLQLAEGGAFGAPTCQAISNIYSEPKVSLTTTDLLLARCCYRMFVFHS